MSNVYGGWSEAGNIVGIESGNIVGIESGNMLKIAESGLDFGLGDLELDPGFAPSGNGSTPNGAQEGASGSSGDAGLQAASSIVGSVTSSVADIVSAYFNQNPKTVVEHANGATPPAYTAPPPQASATPWILAGVAAIVLFVVLRK